MKRPQARTALLSTAAIVAGALLAAFVGGCVNGGATLGVLKQISIPVGSGVSLTRDIQPIFSTNCALSNCHITNSPQGDGLDLSPGNSWANTVNVPSAEAPLLRIVPFNSAQSYLINKLDGTQLTVTTPSLGGARMPSGASPLPSSEIQLIREWIDQGALDN